MDKPYEATTELRQLQPRDHSKLAGILNVSDSWKNFAGILRHPDKPEEILFTSSQISQMEKLPDPSRALLEFWGTFGKNRPTLGSMIALFKNINFLQAAHFLSKELLMLNDEFLENPNVEAIEKVVAAIQEKNALLGEDCMDTDEFLQFQYDHLKIITKDFSVKIGEGAFGAVYYGSFGDRNFAVKKLEKEGNIDELKILQQYKHPNILAVYGISTDGPNTCFVYPYMSNGCLLDCIARKPEKPLLTWQQRFVIALGTVKGLHHLHTSGEKQLIHRDIKSANILLDENLHPKIGDFGVAKIGKPTRGTTSTIITDLYCGTPVYSAPEAFKYRYTVYTDVYSLGVVLLELLSGLPPDDEFDDLVTNYQENLKKKPVSDWTDKSIDWNMDAANFLHELAKRCIEYERSMRPSTGEMLDKFSQFYPDANSLN